MMRSGPDGVIRPITDSERSEIKKCISAFFDAMERENISSVAAAVAIAIMQERFRSDGIRVEADEIKEVN